MRSEQRLTLASLRMKTTFLLATSFATLLLMGCATTPSHSMGCGKCGCKMMQAVAADAHKCAMCAYADADHNKPAEGSKAAPSEHKH